MEHVRIIKFNGFRAEIETMQDGLVSGRIIDIAGCPEFSGDDYASACREFRSVVHRYVLENRMAV